MAHSRAQRIGSFEDTHMNYFLAQLCRFDVVKGWDILFLLLFGLENFPAREMLSCAGC